MYDWSFMPDQVDGMLTAATIEDEIEGEEGGSKPPKSGYFIATVAYGTAIAPSRESAPR